MYVLEKHLTVLFEICCSMQYRTSGQTHTNYNSALHVEQRQISMRMKRLEMDGDMYVMYAGRQWRRRRKQY